MGIQSCNECREKQVEMMSDMCGNFLDDGKFTIEEKEQKFEPKKQCSGDEGQANVYDVKEGSGCRNCCDQIKIYARSWKYAFVFNEKVQKDPVRGCKLNPMRTKSNTRGPYNC